MKELKTNCQEEVHVLVITFLTGKFGKFTELTFLKLRDFKISKKERGKFSPNFTNKHVTPG